MLFEMEDTGIDKLLLVVKIDEEEKEGEGDIE
jgi:hypothetical protein